MEKIYTRINWENEEVSKRTPINAENLNKMDFAIDELDSRLVSHVGNTYTKNEVDDRIPGKVSDLTNDVNYQTYQNVQALIVSQLENFDHLDYKIADSVPTPTTVVIDGQTVPTEEGVRYLVKHATDDRLEEYVLIDGVIYDFGSTGESSPVIIPINPSPEPTAEGAVWFTT